MVQDDLDVYLNEFGEDAVLPGGGTVLVIFDNEYQPLGEYGEGRSITAGGKTEDLQGLRQDDVMVIRGESYRVLSVQPVQDGRMTDLILGE